MPDIQRSFPLVNAIAEHSLLIEFGDCINPAIHARVIALDRALAAAPFAGFLESVPAYTGLLIRFDLLITDHVTAARNTLRLLDQSSSPPAAAAMRTVDVCYDVSLAPDLDAVGQATGLSRETVIAAHLAGNYAVFMYGFAPGYAYLGGVPDAICLPRKPAAIAAIPFGSVLIAGKQCLVSTLTMPSGWWVIGRSPTRILTGKAERPFLFDVGDRVRFRRISRIDHDAAVSG